MLPLAVSSRPRMPQPAGGVTRAGVLALLFAALLLVLPLAPAHAGDDAAAEGFISELATETLAILSDTDRSEADKEGAFRTLLLDNTAIERFGRSALGQYSRLPTDAEFMEYLDALEDYAVQILTSQFGLFTDHTVTVTDSTIHERTNTTYVIVPTDVRDPNRALVAVVQWILIRDAAEYKIFDIRVQTPGESATFSLLQTQRDEFANVLRQNGRTMGALITYLRDATRNEPSATN